MVIFGMKKLFSVGSIWRTGLHNSLLLLSGPSDCGYSSGGGANTELQTFVCADVAAVAMEEYDNISEPRVFHLNTVAVRV